MNRAKCNSTIRGLMLPEQRQHVPSTEPAARSIRQCSTRLKEAPNTPSHTTHPMQAAGRVAVLRNALGKHSGVETLPETCSGFSSMGSRPAVAKTQKQADHLASEIAATTCQSVRHAGWCHTATNMQYKVQARDRPLTPSTPTQLTLQRGDQSCAQSDHKCKTSTSDQATLCNGNLPMPLRLLLRTFRRAPSLYRTKV